MRGHANTTPATCWWMGDLAAVCARRDYEIQAGPILLKLGALLETIGVVHSATLAENVATDFGTIPLAQTPSDSLASLRHSRPMLHEEGRIGKGGACWLCRIDFLSPPDRTQWRLRQAWGHITKTDGA